MQAASDLDDAVEDAWAFEVAVETSDVDDACPYCSCEILGSDSCSALLDDEGWEL